jgi:hypothetical protein
MSVKIARVFLPLRIPPLLGTEHAGLLLRLADKQHAFLAGEPSAIRLRDVVLALMFLKRDEIQLFGLDELLDRRDKPLAQGVSFAKIRAPASGLILPPIGRQDHSC